MCTSKSSNTCEYRKVKTTLVVRNVYATQNKDTVAYKDKVRLWDEMREMLIYQRTLPNQEESTCIEMRSKALGKQLNLPEYVISKILAQLGKEGYVKREELGTRKRPGVFRLFTIDEYETAQVTPRDDYYVPKRATRRSKIKLEQIAEEPVTLEEEIEIDSHEVAADSETIHAEVQNVMPEKSWQYAAPKVEVFQHVSREFFIAGMAELLQAAQESQTTQIRIDEMREAYRREVVQMEREKNSLADDLVIERANARQLQSDLRRERSENEGYVSMADKATRSIRTAKTVAGEIANKLGNLSSTHWGSKGESKTVEVLLEMLDISPRELDEMFDKLQEIRQLDEG